MRIGLVARQDCGGLAAQSIEFARNLPIAATMVVDLGDLGRGPSFDYPWVNPIHVKGPWIDDLAQVRWFLNEVDVVLSIETFYGAMITELAGMRHIPTVRYVNPELYRNEGESHVVLPTNWERDRVPQATVIPQGVTLPINAVVRDKPVATILHMASPAMMDRNGTSDFHAAINHTNLGFRIIVAGPQTKTYALEGRHDWVYDTSYRQDRLTLYSDDIDVLVMPRRFGGLCLPMLEAASFGIPTIALDVSPQNGWFSKGLVPSEGFDTISMVGGNFEVHRTNIPLLTGMIDFYSQNSLRELSMDALEWARSNSWEVITPIWMEFFTKILS